MTSSPLLHTMRKTGFVVAGVALLLALLLLSLNSKPWADWIAIFILMCSSFASGIFWRWTRASQGQKLLDTSLDRYAEQLEQAHVEMHRLQQASDASSLAKSRFLAQMSHDLRTLLNGITGMTELLLNSEQNEKQHRYTERIYYSAEMLLSLINDILDISKIEAGEMELAPEVTNIRSVVEEIIQLFETQIGSKPITLSYEIADSVPEFVLIDSHNAKRVILNLMSNAVKFTQEGQITISMDYKQEISGTQMLHCTVKDTGIGMPEDKCEKIFAPYSQLQSHIKPSIGGTGLGLVIAREIVTLFGGKIRAISRKNEGTTFEWTMLATELPPLIEQNREQLRDVLSSTISIVDIASLSVHGLTLYLAQWGISPTPYANLDEFLNAQTHIRTNWQCIIVDTDFEPVSSQMFRKLEAYCQDHPHVSVILMVSSDIEEEFKHSQVITLLRKPFQPSELLLKMCNIKQGISNRAYQTTYRFPQQSHIR